MFSFDVITYLNNCLMVCLFASKKKLMLKVKLQKKRKITHQTKNEKEYDLQITGIWLFVSMLA
jgi:hypothetical protein